MRFWILGAMVALGSGAPAGLAGQQGPSEVGALAWMAGCWRLEARGRITEEQWMAPRGGLMLGMSRTVVRDTAREWEHLQIGPRDGRLVYVARPSGQAETMFPVESLADSGVTFGNPAHDFPQRIRYRPIGADSLVARIEGQQGGRTRGIDFPMRRVACVDAGSR